MIKGEIISKADKFGHVINFKEEGMQQGTWLKITEAAYKFAQRGKAAIDKDEKGLVVKVFMDDNAQAAGVPVGNSLGQSPPRSPDTQKTIGNQWAINAAIEFLRLAKYEGDVTIEHVKNVAKDLLSVRDEL